MSYKIKTIDPGRWLINDNIEVANSYVSMTNWLKRNTNIYDSSWTKTDRSYERIFENFLKNGFTPLPGCYGSKTTNEKTKLPEYNINDTINWFLFDGVSYDRSTFPPQSLLSIAVNYNPERGNYTVYYHQPNQTNRIAVYDVQDEIFKLTENYLPVHIKDWNKNNYEIDWDKVINLSIVGDKIGVTINKPVLFPARVRGFTISMDIWSFEKRINNIINKVSKYIPNESPECTGLPGDPNDYLHQLGNNTNIIEFTHYDGIDKTGFTLHFDFIDHSCVLVSLLQKNGEYKFCAESVMVKRMQESEIISKGKYGDVDFIDKETKTEEIIKYYLPMLGVYFADPNEINNNDCGCKDETEEQ